MKASEAKTAAADQRVRKAIKAEALDLANSAIASAVSDGNESCKVYVDSAGDANRVRVNLEQNGFACSVNTAEGVFTLNINWSDPTGRP